MNTKTLLRSAFVSVILALAIVFAGPALVSAQTSESSATATEKHSGGYSYDQVPEGDVPSNDQLIKLLKEQNKRLKEENAKLKAEIQKLKAGK